MQIFRLLIKFFTISSIFLLSSCTRSAISEAADNTFPTREVSYAVQTPSPEIFDTKSETETPQNPTQVISYESQQFDLLSIGYMETDLLIITLSSQQKIEREYFGQIGSTQFECVQQENFPKRLYCFGDNSSTKNDISFSLYQMENQTKKVFEIEINLEEIIEQE